MNKAFGPLLAVQMASVACLSPATECNQFASEVERKIDECITTQSTSDSVLSAGNFVSLADSGGDDSRLIGISRQLLGGEEQLASFDRVLCVDATRFVVDERCTAAILEGECSDLILCIDPSGGPDIPCGDATTVDGVSTITGLNGPSSCDGIVIEGPTF